MPLKLLPAEPSDARQIADMVFAAFGEDTLHQAMFPREHRASYEEWDVKQTARGINKHPFLQNLKVIDTDLGPNTIIGYARWEFPHAPVEADPEKIPFPEHVNAALLKEFGRRMMENKKGKYDSSKDYQCHILATHPDHRGRGAAGMILHYAMDDADKNDAEVYLDASPAGYPIYLKYGWHQYDVMTIDPKEFGVADSPVYKNINMVRPKKSEREANGEK